MLLCGLPSLGGPNLHCSHLLTLCRLRSHFLFSFQFCVCGNKSTVCGLEVGGGGAGKGTYQLVSQSGELGQVHLPYNSDVTCVAISVYLLALTISNACTFKQSFTLCLNTLFLFSLKYIHICIKGNKNVKRVFMQHYRDAGVQMKYCKSQCYIVKLKKGCFFLTLKKNFGHFSSIQYCLHLFHMPNINLNILFYNNLKIGIWWG